MYHRLLAALLLTVCLVPLASGEAGAASSMVPPTPSPSSL